MQKLIIRANDDKTVKSHIMLLLITKEGTFYGNFIDAVFGLHLFT